MISYSAIYSIIALRLKDFFSEYQYSLLAPITTNMLFILVFLTIEKYYSLSIDTNSFVQFIAPGLIIMIVAQESYDNPSVTLVNMKQTGSLDDWLLAPISRIEILISLLINSIVIGFIIALCNLIIFSFLIDIQIINYLFFCYYLILVIIFFACLGCFVGILFKDLFIGHETSYNFWSRSIKFIEPLSTEHPPMWFLVLTPISLLLRIFRKDILGLRFHKRESYWIKRKNNIGTMKNQF